MKKKSLLLAVVFMFIFSPAVINNVHSAEQNIDLHKTFLFDDNDGKRIDAKAVNRTDREKLMHRSDVNIYPNPARNQLTVEMMSEFSVCKVMINDLIGNIVSTQLCNEANITLINVDNLPDGLYTVTILNNSTVMSQQKIMVVK